MQPDHTPDGYSTVSPYLVVDGASATIAFLKRAFDATEKGRHQDASGRIRHAEVRIGECVVMVADPVQAPERKDDADKRGGVRDAGGTTWWIATRVNGA